ncbi:hypothetical protein PsorP6_001717 [Peronosclerospora sorghi]|uniref:Uncharacterized protein n=1 Tax=Peronosclerospora sorghi TaxID=230839 RepID=A0ACC0WSD0_9STRA|nr:hypothetical protein PsorP6_001717 [Peronosclerospora sorghi]
MPTATQTTDYATIASSQRQGKDRPVLGPVGPVVAVLLALFSGNGPVQVVEPPIQIRLRLARHEQFPPDFGGNLETQSLRTQRHDVAHGETAQERAIVALEIAQGRVMERKVPALPVFDRPAFFPQPSAADDRVFHLGRARAPVGFGYSGCHGLRRGLSARVRDLARGLTAY